MQLRKIDPKSGKQVAGATYAIYNDKGQELERLVTTATGYVESGYLRFGNYTVREVIAPSGYILNKTSYPVTIATNEQKITVTGEDERQTGRLELTKEDSVTKVAFAVFSLGRAVVFFHRLAGGLLIERFQIIQFFFKGFLGGNF